MTKTREWPVMATKHKNRWLIVPFVLLLISALFFPTIIVYAAPDTAVIVDPASTKVGIGETFTVDIYVTPDTDIAGMQFNLSFTPSVVTANSVTEGNLLTQDGDLTFFMPGTINNGAGTINDVAGAITAAGQTVSSPGTFATINFTAGTTTGTSPLTLSNVIVGGPGGEVAITVTDGSVTVYADWDVDMNGSVNVLDMTAVGQHWGETGAVHWIREDVKRDGEINVLDMILIGQHWTG